MLGALHALALILPSLHLFIRKKLGAWSSDVTHVKITLLANEAEIKLRSLSKFHCTDFLL